MPLPAGRVTSDGQTSNIFTGANYTEGLLVGYRYYDAHQIRFTSGFPFGHGLSYTTFEYASLKVTPTEVSFTLANSGTQPGAEVPQLYLEFPPEAGEPPRVLRGFSKHYLTPGESKVVRFPITQASTRFWDVLGRGWKQAPGVFGVYVGSSSRDARLAGKLRVA